MNIVRSPIEPLITVEKADDGRSSSDSESVEVAVVHGSDQTPPLSPLRMGLTSKKDKNSS